MKVSRVSGALGGSVSQLDVSAALADGSISVLRALLHEHDVLFLRAPALSPAEQPDLARLFGPLPTTSA